MFCTINKQQSRPYTSRLLCTLAFEPFVAATMLLSAAASADIYKCESASGEVTYSQAPCADNSKAVIVDGAQSERSSAPDCRTANRFAYETAKSMKAGATSSDVFNRYGGLDSISKGTINLINYVYSYRAADSVSSQRIAGLAQSRCQSGALKNAACEDFPISFTDSLGGCSPDDEDSELVQSAADREAPVQRSEQSGFPIEAPVRASNENTSLHCKENYRKQIADIDRQMKSGYSSSQGDRFRERRRALQALLRRC